MRRGLALMTLPISAAPHTRSRLFKSVPLSADMAQFPFARMRASGIEAMPSASALPISVRNMELFAVYVNGHKLLFNSKSLCRVHVARSCR